MSKCIQVAPVLACFDNGTTKQTLIQHILYEEGVAIGQAYTGVDSEVIVDVSGGTVTLGACPIAPPDVEWDRQCDRLADGSVVPFYCRVLTSFDANGDIASVVTANFELDKTTAYTIAGTPEPCGECAPVGSVGTITAWSDIA